MAFIPFPTGQFGGAVAVNVFAILCALALCSVAIRALWLVVHCLLVHSSVKPREYVFFSTQLGNYAGCLLIAMIFNALAGMMGLPWLIDRGITEGVACTVQGFLMQLGTWSSGYFTVSIALHTFNTLVLRRKQSIIVSRSAMSVGWALSILMASVPFFLPKPDGDIYGADGFLCGIRSIYPQVKFFMHVLPILIASILSAVFYSIIFLALRGTLRIKGGIKLTLNPDQRWTVVQGDSYHQFIARIARSMIWYPIAYVALLVPYSVMRLLGISGFFVPFEASVFAATCWFALGVVNVALFYNTFRVLEPAFEGTPYLNNRRDLESATVFDKEYSNSFRPRQALGDQEKSFSQMHNYRSPSMNSITSAERLLPSHGKTLSQDSASGFGRTAYRSDEILSSPQAALQRGQALAHSPQSSVSSAGGSSPSQRFRTPLPSAPVSADGRYNPSSSPASSPSRIPGGLWNADSLPSSREYDAAPASNNNYYGMTPAPTTIGSSSAFRSPSGSPPRQLTLVAEQNYLPPTGVISKAPSKRISPQQRPLLLSKPRGQMMDDDDAPSAFINPRTPPELPSFLNTRP